MKVNKLFHYLYAFLLVVPFLALIFNLASRLFSQASLDDLTMENVLAMVEFPSIVSSSVSETIFNFFNNTFLTNIMGFSGYINVFVSKSLTYWVLITLTWILFDVFMLVPNMIHKMIDKASGVVS